MARASHPVMVMLFSMAKTKNPCRKQPGLIMSSLRSGDDFQFQTKGLFQHHIPFTMSACARDPQSTCPPGQNYYICSSIPYIGCCSHDPCQSGMCDNNASDGICVPVTLTVTETVYSGTTSSIAGASGLGTNDAADSGAVIPSVGSATLAAPTNLNNSSSIVQDTTVRITATATNTFFTTNTLTSSSSPSSLPKASITKSTSTASPHPSSVSSPVSQTSKGAVAGSVIGALAGVGLLALLLLCCCRHRKRLRLKFKLKGSDASELDEKAKELRLRETALTEAERRKRRAPRFVGRMYGGAFVIDRGLGSPTGSGESGTGAGSGSGRGSGSGMRRQSQDARKQVGRWI